MKNKTIIWYTVKYFILGTVTIYVWQLAGKLATAKDDFQNIIGSALLAGLFLTWVLVFKHDLGKVVEK
jgi:hypothetical protein